jgi:CMP-N-acetylneuraminic acid synthetase
MPRETAVDIDTDFDFQIAELLMGAATPSQP